MAALRGARAASCGRSAGSAIRCGVAGATAGFRRITGTRPWTRWPRRSGRRPGRVALYLTSRGITNETYYVAGKAARALGIANVDSAARVCHARRPSA